MDSISLLAVLVRIVCCSHIPHLPLHLNPHPHSLLLSPHHHLHTTHRLFDFLVRYLNINTIQHELHHILLYYSQYAKTWWPWLVLVSVCLLFSWFESFYTNFKEININSQPVSDCLGNIGLLNIARIPGPHTDRCELPLCTRREVYLRGEIKLQEYSRASPAFDWLNVFLPSERCNLAPRDDCV